jgi:Fur family zinc uptake transcriptional regulator
MNVEEALSILKQKGYKFTGKREEMVRIFAKERRYLTAKEMLEYMQGDYPSLSFDTIYRNLNLFEELDILETTQLNGERIFRLSCETDHHHHHLICTECGKTHKIDICPMDAILGEPKGFKITGHKFEIYGSCEECEVQ